MINSKKNIAILLEFGFHEIKKYIHSGFIDVISKEFNIVWIALDKGSEDFDRYFKNTGFPLVYVNEGDVRSKSSRIEEYNRIIRRNWVTNKEVGAFHNHAKIKEKSFKTIFFGSTLLKNLIENLTLSSVSKSYRNDKLRSIFNRYQIDSLFITGTSSSFAKYAVMTASDMEIPVHYLINSWKDLYVNNFIPFKNLSTIFVWSERMKSDYLTHMPYLKNTDVIVSGNPTFDVLIDSKPYYDRAYYVNRYGLQIGAKWLLYTMMPDGLVSDEIGTILYTASEIKKEFSKEQFMIIIRKNPTHAQDDFTNIELPDNVVLADHYCSFDKKNDMIVQSKEGEVEWIDLLQHSTLNLSVPSTVTLEFLTLGKPVLNIAYNEKNQIDHRVDQFFNAGFYLPLFKQNNVRKIENSEVLINELKKLDDLLKMSKSEQRNASQIIVKHLAKIN